MTFTVIVLAVSCIDVACVGADSRCDTKSEAFITKMQSAGAWMHGGRRSSGGGSGLVAYLKRTA